MVMSTRVNERMGNSRGRAKSLFRMEILLKEILKVGISMAKGS